MDKRDKKEMNRREFLKIVGVSTVASTVAMYGCASGEKSNASEASILGEVPVDKMTYRTSPKGEHVSLLGYGCMRWPLKPAPDSDGNVIESVLMRYHHGNSVCISSQVGCRMGCRFCASTIGGLTRCLKPSEMLDQIYRIQADTGERVANVVVMGTGEPMDNYDNLVRFVRILTDENGLGISQRNVTVSTCGIVPKMYDLAEEKLQITLALSLHAPNDEKRQELMPIANKYSMDEVLDACRNYFDKTGRRITFEYSLVAGVNDSEEDARQLAGRIKGINCHVNLIPVNPIKERSYVRSTRQAVENFKIKLEKYGINVTIRREMGSDIDGACGQLRKSYMEKTESEK